MYLSDSSDSDSSDGEWKEFQHNKSENSDSEINTKINMCNDNLFSYNKLDLTNNLFVYNHKSYPTKLRNKIKREIKHMPELVGILNSKTNKNINSKKIKQKMTVTLNPFGLRRNG